MAEEREPVVLTVTANPALDLTYTVAGIDPGGSHRVDAPLVRAGGKGVNVSRVAHRQGFATRAIATAGGDTGGQLRADLAAAGIPHTLVDVAAPTRRTIALVDTVSGLTSIFNERGPALAPADWQALAAAVVDRLQGAGVLVGAGSLPDGAPADFYPALVTLAHGAGVPAIIDTSGPGILAAARAGADLLKPNNHELRDAMGETDLVAAAGKLLALGARRVLVSVGADGMLGFDAARPGTYVQAKLPAPLAGNPTGAGDAAVSAAAVALAHGETDLVELVRRATAWSAAAVLAPGAGEISDRHAELADQLTITEHRFADQQGPLP
ncbi:1-phosphofructokinase family hexose kinase [Specibacter cremeus]|uniref:1-phosphofructokinase family hexose kinase n=1 Tax=Specibacter cremeus TaxID=1629051 RepID=UPI000F7A85D2|nr:1-phosphofructokinase family hexose kinase [Specibacter cremeus]